MQLCFVTASQLHRVFRNRPSRSCAACTDQGEVYIVEKGELRHVPAPLPPGRPVGARLPELPEGPCMSYVIHSPLERQVGVAVW